MTQNKPLALLTNDDGIESSFLLALVEAFSSSFEVVTCAPDGERSWIGHAISRNAKLLPHKIDDYPSLAYALNGTPADCVNLACGNLLPKAPDLVVSGINLGYNVTLPMILSSGTVGAAMEASLLGFRAMAASMALPNDQFETIRESCGKKMDNQVRKSLRHSAEACAQYALDVIGAPVPEGLVVHNLNFPIGYNGEHDPMISFAGSLNLGSFFEKGDEEKAYQLVYHPERLEAAKVEVGSDLWVMREGMPSVSRLDFSGASGKTYLEP